MHSRLHSPNSNSMSNKFHGIVCDNGDYCSDFSFFTSFYAERLKKDKFHTHTL
jgi:hypothetical protein